MVERLGLDASRITDQQVRLLSTPFNLSLLARVADTSGTTALDFTTIQDLYGRFWSEKQRRVADICCDPVAWNGVIDKLCQYMSREQTLRAC